MLSASRWFLVAACTFSVLLPVYADPKGAPVQKTSPQAADAPARAAASPADSAPRSAANGQLPEDAGQYILRAGDELVITYLGVDDPPYDIKVRDDGGIFIPRIGEVKAAGYTISQLRPIMEARLAKHLLHSDIEIGLKSVAPHYVMVLGEASKGGQIEVVPHMTLVQVLAAAGGMTAQADTGMVTLIRNHQQLKVPMSGPSAMDIEVQPNDVIMINKASRISVMGAVQSPAVVGLSTNATVWDALEAVGGPKPEAAMGRIKLVRFGAAENTTLLDLSKGPASADAKTVLQAGDMITVPEQHVLFVSLGDGGKTGAMPITGPTPLFDLLVQAGVGDKHVLSTVAIIRAKDMKTLDPNAAAALPPDKVEKINVADAVKSGKQDQLTMVNDGDVVMVDPKTRTNGVLNALQYVQLLTIWRLL